MNLIRPLMFVGVVMFMLVSLTVLVIPYHFETAIHAHHREWLGVKTVAVDARRDVKRMFAAIQTFPLLGDNTNLVEDLTYYVKVDMYHDFGVVGHRHVEYHYKFNIRVDVPVLMCLNQSMDACNDIARRMVYDNIDKFNMDMYYCDDSDMKRSWRNFVMCSDYFWVSFGGVWYPNIVNNMLLGATAVVLALTAYWLYLLDENDVHEITLRELEEQNEKEIEDESKKKEKNDPDEDEDTTCCDGKKEKKKKGDKDRITIYSNDDNESVLAKVTEYFNEKRSEQQEEEDE